MRRTDKEEIKLLCAAVDHFANAMKIKLIAETKAGKRGWDGDHPEQDLCEQMSDDALDIRHLNLSGNKNKRAVDIANRAMMVWYRHGGKELVGITNPVK